VDSRRCGAVDKKISKIELITRENLKVNGVAFLFASKLAFFVT